MLVRTPLQLDECRWFLAAVDQHIVSFEGCPADCFRLAKWKAAGPDHFVTPSGKPRHLFSKPGETVAWLNREYIPHIAAYAYAILEGGFDPRQSSFSLYRKFSRDLITKRAGGSFETDAEFYDIDGGVFLQIEAKASERETATLAAAIERHGALSELPTTAAKEVEYVLDLAPKYLWIVGPGSLDPPRYLYRVSTVGPLNVAFDPVEEFPSPPTLSAP